MSLSNIAKADRLRYLRDITAAWEDAHAGRVDALPADYPRLVARFSLRNVMLILAQRPGATECAGFHEWRKVGRVVRKGAAGIAILVPIGGGRDADSGEETRPRFTYRYVFDIADTDSVSVAGDDAPRLARDLVAV